MSGLDDLFVCLRFFSRLPLPRSSYGKDCATPTLSDAASAVPIAGAIIAIPPCLALLLALAVGLPAALAAPLSLATLVAVTGALHEDGLADCADGFGGGRTREHKLQIMRDSRIGTFGACTVALSLYLRAAALGLVATRSPSLACAALVAAASLSRTASLMPLMLLPPARSDGLGAGAGKPFLKDFAIAVGLAIFILLATIPSGATVGTLATAVVTAAIGALAVSALAWRQVRGQTGDVAGAAQQVAEIVVMLTFAAG